jgi:hypothetical protein
MTRQPKTDGEPDMEGPGVGKKRGGMIHGHKEMSSEGKHGHKPMMKKGGKVHDDEKQDRRLIAMMMSKKKPRGA